jgi:hypothetical protein
MRELIAFIKEDLMVGIQGLGIAAIVAAGFIVYANIWG